MDGRVNRLATKVNSLGCARASVPRRSSSVERKRHLAMQIDKRLRKVQREGDLHLVTRTDVLAMEVTVQPFQGPLVFFEMEKLPFVPRAVGGDVIAGRAHEQTAMK